ncbi:MAG TPA: NAD-dependent epimerase/dehydratase family protein [Candidatus Angelobacter sp.]|jgi:dTDP-L-rhamnose 4-epimerase|nr:NAD-dependent epimerase/dehydratase family protein [Candidatus Angelobacter sp.]
MAKNILITGGAGFVGSHLTDALLASGHNVRIFDNLTEQVHHDGIPDYLSPDAEFVYGDVRDANALRRALSGIDVVFHLAAAVGVGQSMYEIERYMGTNTQGTAVLLQELLPRLDRMEKLILASSMSIYGEGKYLCAHCGDAAPGPRSTGQLRLKQWEPACPSCGSTLTPAPTDESKPLQCSSIYSLSKKDQEEMCLLFGRTYGLPVVALRYFNIYGTRQSLSNPYTGVAAIFASRLMNGNSPMIFEDGQQLRDFVSVKDIVRANLLAMERPQAHGMALNIGSGQPISIREVATELARAMDTKIPAELTQKYRVGDVRHCFADISAANQFLGYEPQVRFTQGLTELAQWLCSQQPQDRAAEAVAQLSEFGLTA